MFPNITELPKSQDIADHSKCLNEKSILYPLGTVEDYISCLQYGTDPNSWPSTSTSSSQCSVARPKFTTEILAVPKKEEIKETTKSNSEPTPVIDQIEKMLGRKIPDRFLSMLGDSKGSLMDILKKSGNHLSKLFPMNSKDSSAVDLQSLKRKMEERMKKMKSNSNRPDIDLSHLDNFESFKRHMEGKKSSRPEMDAIGQLLPGHGKLEPHPYPDFESFKNRLKGSSKKLPSLDERRKKLGSSGIDLESFKRQIAGGKMPSPADFKKFRQRLADARMSKSNGNKMLPPLSPLGEKSGKKMPYFPDFESYKRYMESQKKPEQKENKKQGRGRKGFGFKRRMGMGDDSGMMSGKFSPLQAMLKGRQQFKE